MDGRENQSDNASPQGAEQGFNVGYGKPPSHTRFKKGVSGNPSGRPKKKPTFVDEFEKALSRKVPVMIDGKTVMRSRREIAAEQWANKHAQGKPEALEVALRFDPHFAPPETNQTAIEPKDLLLWFTLNLEENDPGPHWQLIGDGDVMLEG